MGFDELGEAERRRLHRVWAAKSRHKLEADDADVDVTPEFRIAALLNGNHKGSGQLRLVVSIVQERGVEGGLGQWPDSRDSICSSSG
jgi:hypothetical protein